MYRLVAYETLINVNGGTLYFIGLLAGKTKKLLNLQLRTVFISFIGKVEEKNRRCEEKRVPRLVLISQRLYTEPLPILLKL
jgi:hypothetical protein